MDSALTVMEAILAYCRGLSLAGIMGTSTCTLVFLTLLQGLGSPSATIVDGFLSPVITPTSNSPKMPLPTAGFSFMVHLLLLHLDPVYPSLHHIVSAIFVNPIHTSFPAALSLLEAKSTSLFKCKDIKHFISVQCCCAAVSNTQDKQDLCRQVFNSYFSNSNY